MRKKNIVELESTDISLADWLYSLTGGQQVLVTDLDFLEPVTIEVIREVTEDKIWLLNIRMSFDSKTGIAHKNNKRIMPTYWRNISRIKENQERKYLTQKIPSDWSEVPVEKLKRILKVLEADD